MLHMVLCVALHRWSSHSSNTLKAKGTLESGMVRPKNDVWRRILGFRDGGSTRTSEGQLWKIGDMTDIQEGFVNARTAVFVSFVHNLHF